MPEFDRDRPSRFDDDEELRSLIAEADADSPIEELWEPSDAVIVRPELEQLSIRLPKDDLVQLRIMAESERIGLTTLIRMMVREQLRLRDQLTPLSMNTEVQGKDIAMATLARQLTEMQVELRETRMAVGRLTEDVRAEYKTRRPV